MVVLIISVYGVIKRLVILKKMCYTYYRKKVEENFRLFFLTFFEKYVYLNLLGVPFAEKWPKGC